MPTTRVTISDLAERLHLSTCTVSKILNKSFEGVSYASGTIKRVEEMAKATGYRVNAQARALRTKRSNLVGFILPSARNSVFGELTHQLEFQLRASGRQLLIGHSQSSRREEAQLLSAFLSRGVDGIFWVPSRERLRLADYPLPEGFPVVMLDRPGCCAQAPCVATDNHMSSRLLAERVWSCGHRHVAVLNASRSDKSMKERFAGIKDIFASSITLCDIDNTTEAARLATDHLLREPRRFSALLALSEPLAIGALSAMRDQNTHSPSELSFAAFDDFPLAAYWMPRTTLLRQDIEAIAGEATRIMAMLLDRPENPVGDIRVPAILEWRESVATCKVV